MFRSTFACLIAGIASLCLSSGWLAGSNVRADQAESSRPGQSHTGQSSTGQSSTGQSNTSLKILLVTSGCCHDYDFQTKQLQLAVKQAGIDAVWTVASEGGNRTAAKFSIYQNEDWADGFDVVIHNECFAKTTDPNYVRRITSAHHAGVNAVVIHCAMHTYRDTDIDDWREFLGVTSKRHEHQSRYAVTVEKPQHPIMREFPASFVTPTDELYIIEKVWPQTTVLATSVSEKNDKVHPVFWTNQYGQARVFGTTYGHSNETFSNEVFLNTLVRGILWSTGRLE